MEKFIEDITGIKFGKLTALAYDHRGKHCAYWQCRCDCGNICIVPRQNLISGKTKSCGCLRSTSIQIRRGVSHKVQVSDSVQAWIIRHYQHSKNAEIMDKYGLSEGWLHRFARANGLKKSPRFMRMMQKTASDGAQRSHRLNRTYPPKGYKIPRSSDNYFQPGVTCEQRLGKKKDKARIAKSAATRKETYKREQQRVYIGLPQKTKMRVTRQSARIRNQRWYLVSHGYIIERGSMTAYYDSNTRRCVRMESGLCPFRFYPVENKCNNIVTL